jgi:Undecaprenyl-phosphate glucose phosphotransferase
MDWAQINMGAPKLGPRFGTMHSNGIVIAATLIGDLIIAMITYWMFITKVLDFYWDDYQMHTAYLVGVIYAAIIMNGGVIVYVRNVKRFQIVTLVARNVLLFALIAIPIIKLGHFHSMYYKVIPLFLLSLVVTVSAFRLCVRWAILAYRKGGKYVNKVVFLGSKENNIALYREMRSISSLGYVVLGYFDDKPNPNFPKECEYLGTPAQIENYLNDKHEVHELFCCLTSDRAEEIMHIMRYCDKHLIHFYNVPNVSNYLHRRVYFNMLGNVPYLSLYREPLSRPENRLLKRLFDIFVSGLFLCTIFPFVYIIVAIITKVTMPGPVFFKQKRNGLNGKEFYCYKFRSMKVNDDADKVQATKNDPRKTKWGDIMRKTNIDELPQFWNVLKGDMSVVGPRPHMLKHTKEYSELIDKYMIRHFVKPGITGWSQVTGFRGETKELSQMEGRIEGDIWYIEHWSLGLDLYIMYRTVMNVIQGDKEAY